MSSSKKMTLKAKTKGASRLSNLVLTLVLVASVFFIFTPATDETEYAPDGRGDQKSIAEARSVKSTEPRSLNDLRQDLKWIKAGNQRDAILSVGDSDLSPSQKVDLIQELIHSPRIRQEALIALFQDLATKGYDITSLNILRDQLHPGEAREGVDEFIVKQFGPTQPEEVWGWLDNLITSDSKRDELRTELSLVFVSRLSVAGEGALEDAVFSGIAQMGEGKTDVYSHSLWRMVRELGDNGNLSPELFYSLAELEGQETIRKATEALGHTVGFENIFDAVDLTRLSVDAVDKLTESVVRNAVGLTFAEKLALVDRHVSPSREVEILSGLYFGELGDRLENLETVFGQIRQKEVARHVLQSVSRACSIAPSRFNLTSEQANQTLGVVEVLNRRME
jgi:hypothetical protein